MSYTPGTHRFAAGRISEAERLEVARRELTAPPLKGGAHYHSAGTRLSEELASSRIAVSGGEIMIEAVVLSMMTLFAAPTDGGVASRVSGEEVLITIFRGTTSPGRSRS